MADLCFLTVKSGKLKARIELSVYERENGSLKEEKSFETESHLYVEIYGKIVIPIGLSDLNLNLVIRECAGNVEISEERIVIH